MVKSGFIRLMIRRTVSNDDPTVKKTDSYVCSVGVVAYFLCLKIKNDGLM